MHIQDALDYWQQKKLLTKQKADELRANLPAGGHENRLRAIEIFTAIGAILVGLGIILFVGSHWEEMTPVLRTAILLITVLVTGGIGYWLAFEKKTYEKTGVALMFINVLAFGAAIFLVAQIYHLPLTFWWGMLLWYIGTAYFAYVLQSRIHLWLSVPLFLTFLGWLMTSSVGGQELEFLFDERVRFLALLAPMGVWLISESILHERSTKTKFAAPTLFHWGLFVSLVLIVVTTVDKWVFFHFFRYPTDIVSIAVALIAAVALGTALLWGRFNTKEGKGGLIGLALYFVFLFVLGKIPEWKGLVFNDNAYASSYTMLENNGLFSAIYVLHVLLAFVFQLTVIWYGMLLRRPIVINLAMFAIAVTIIIQYFSWAFDMLPRSFAFIIGGLIILGLGAVLERQRRKLLSTM